MLFFLSSRRRHTRWPRDWSSDVCSSDLYLYYCRNLGVESPFFAISEAPDRYEGRCPRCGSGRYCCSIYLLSADYLPDEPGLPRLRMARDHRCKIGRASCRERVWGLVGWGVV